MSEKRYALHPGYVSSQNDGETHYLTSGRLAQLYGIPLRECVVIDSASSDFASKMERYKDLIHLYPDHTGDYLLPGRDAV